MDYTTAINKIRRYKILAFLIVSLMVLTMVVFPVSAQSKASHNGTTENDPPITCRLGELVTGIECSDKFCKRINLLCSHGENFEINRRYWSKAISEEESNGDLGVSSSSSRDSVSSNSLVLSSNKFISGISCQGHYCDNISVEVSEIKNIVKEDCAWSPWISDEHGEYRFPAGKYASGIQCRGHNCDDKRLNLCDAK